MTAPQSRAHHDMNKVQLGVGVPLSATPGQHLYQRPQALVNLSAAPNPCKLGWKLIVFLRTLSINGVFLRTRHLFLCSEGLSMISDSDN